MPPPILEALQALRTELVDLAYTLEVQGRLDAADLAVSTSLRISLLCDELDAARAGPSSESVPVNSFF